MNWSNYRTQQPFFMINRSGIECTANVLLLEFPTVVNYLTREESHTAYIRGGAVVSTPVCQEEGPGLVLGSNPA